MSNWRQRRTLESNGVNEHERTQQSSCLDNVMSCKSFWQHTEPLELQTSILLDGRVMFEAVWYRTKPIVIGFEKECPCQYTRIHTKTSNTYSTAYRVHVGRGVTRAHRPRNCRHVSAVARRCRRGDSVDGAQWPSLPLHHRRRRVAWV